MDTPTCPCCGQPAPKTAHPKGLADVPMRPTAKRIVAELIRAYPRGVSARQLADRVYAMDANGGPDDAENCIYVHLHKAKPIIRQYGWEAGAFGHHGIRLQRIGA